MNGLLLLLGSRPQLVSAGALLDRPCWGLFLLADDVVDDRVLLLFDSK